ncbi:MAG TPA: GNAT family N-acetyltransferase [Chloroflexota bacterium]|nr:GNAT family N-acetyltransferase [Chloroflexota bacterium]
MSPTATASPRVFEVHDLDFDTRLFGARMGSIVRANDLPASADALRATLGRARGEGYAHLILRAGAEDNTAIWAAEACGMRLVDVGVDSTFDLRRTPLPEQPATPFVREARSADLPPLQDLAATAFVRSRFVVDPFFSREANELLHRTWLKNLFGGLAQSIFVADVGGQAAGFVSNSVNNREARIPLIATNAEFRRTGIGRALVARAVSWSAEQGVPVAHVKTQAHNYPALALYHRAGYVVSKTELTFSVTLAQH